MLQEDSRKLEIEREELSFYSNACLYEMRRVGNDNGKLLIDHFIQMSQTQCSYINNTHVMWADFLSHFQDELREDGPALHEGEIDAPADETADDQNLMSNTSGLNKVQS